MTQSGLGAGGLAGLGGGGVDRKDGAAAASIFILSDEASILMCAWRTSVVVVEEEVQRPLLSVAEPRGAPSRTGRTTIALLSDYSVL